MMDLELYSDPSYSLEFEEDFNKNAQSEIYQEEEYDAINEETFGADVNDLADLEDFANQVLLVLDLASAENAKIPLTVTKNFFEEKRDRGRKGLSGLRFILVLLLNYLPGGTALKIKLKPQ